MNNNNNNNNNIKLHSLLSPIKDYIIIITIHVHVIYTHLITVSTSHQQFLLILGCVVYSIPHRTLLIYLIC